MASILNKVAEHLVCSICLEEYNEPKVLPCLHSYCYECITKLERTNDAITCPECRLEVKIGNPPDFTSLPSNFFIKNIQTTVSLKSDTAKKCENCDSGDIAEGRCQECCRYLCEVCIKYHKRSIDTKSHVVKALDDLKDCNPRDVAMVMYCPNVKHKNEIVKFFCVPCQETACRDCVILDHRDHDVVLVDDVVAETREEFEQLLSEAKNRLETVKESLQEVQNTEKNLGIKADTEISKIRQYFESFRALEDRVVGDVKEVQSFKVKKLQTQQEELEAKVLSLQSSLQFTEDAFEAGSNVQLLNMKKFIKESLNSFGAEENSTVPCVTDHVEFLANKTDNDIVSEIFSYFSIRDESVDDKVYERFRFVLKGGNNMKVGQTAELEIHNSMTNSSNEKPPVVKLILSGIKIDAPIFVYNIAGGCKVRIIPLEVGTLIAHLCINGRRLPYQFVKNVLWTWMDDRPSNNTYFGNLWSSACFHMWKIKLDHDSDCLCNKTKCHFDIGVVDKDGDFQGLSGFVKDSCTITVEIDMWLKTMIITKSRQIISSKYTIISDTVRPYLDINDVDCKCEVSLLAQENASMFPETTHTIDVKQTFAVL